MATGSEYGLSGENYLSEMFGNFVKNGNFDGNFMIHDKKISNYLIAKFIGIY